MKRLKAQFKLMFKSRAFVLTLLAMMIFVAINFIVNVITYSKNYIMEVPTANFLMISSGFFKINLFYSVYILTLPLFAVIPFSDTFFVESKKNTIDFCLAKMSNKNYYFSKLIVVFFSGLLVIAIPLLWDMLISVIAFPLNSTNAVIGNTTLHAVNFFGKNEENKYLFYSMIINHPYLYYLLYVLIQGVSAGLIAVITFQFSFFYRRSHILLLCSVFSVYCFSSIILTAFGIHIGLNEYIFPLADTVTDQSATIAIFLALALIAGVIVPIPFALRKLNNLVE